MRALLKLSVLLTVAVAWATGATPDPVRRAPERPCATAPADAELVPEPLPPNVEDDIARVEIPVGDDRWTVADADAIEGDSRWLPFEFLPVDGETGAVTQAKASAVAESAPAVNEATTWRSTNRVPRGEQVLVEGKVAPARGYVPDTGYRKVGYVSRRAERVRFLAPLRREADVRLRVLDASGRPVAGARVKDVILAGAEPVISRTEGEDGTPLGDSGSYLSFVADPTDAEGYARVRGIPHLLDERFWILAGVEAHESYAELALGSFGSAHEVLIRLPAEPTWVSQPLCISMGGGRGGRRNLSCCGPVAPARLEVLVFRRDGSAASGVLVALGLESGKTDDQGRVVFEDLRPRSYDLEVRDPDFVWSKASVELRGGESRVVELMEPLGWTARATLLDDKGRRVPYARVDVSPEAPVKYVRIVDGVQDLALWTDARGEIVLPEMHRAPVSLRFRYGSREASVTIDETDPYALVRLPPP